VLIVNITDEAFVLGNKADIYLPSIEGDWFDTDGKKHSGYLYFKQKVYNTLEPWNEYSPYYEQKPAHYEWR
jgi:hypothetical protein